MHATLLGGKIGKVIERFSGRGLKAPGMLH